MQTNESKTAKFSSGRPKSCSPIWYSNVIISNGFASFLTCLPLSAYFRTLAAAVDFLPFFFACWLLLLPKFQMALCCYLLSAFMRCHLYFPTALFSFAHWFKDINFYLYIVRICFPSTFYSFTFAYTDQFRPFLNFPIRTSDEHFSVTCVESLPVECVSVCARCLRVFHSKYPWMATCLLFVSNKRHPSHISLFSLVVLFLFLSSRLRWNQLIINALQTEKVNKLKTRVNFLFWLWMLLLLFFVSCSVCYVCCAEYSDSIAFPTTIYAFRAFQCNWSPSFT